ncbi:uncharacterized protein LOC120007282 [Tripterygium wilfordii]|uniref:uncharacterized protein LOC120007282 n=1 Tax=Tripterygium wilfordii TaxID=458696 RepID=UPI0018F84A99|nr:uncharacterized protein LOC120007282 [Tripterygium wilfordii]
MKQTEEVEVSIESNTICRGLRVVVLRIVKKHEQQEECDDEVQETLPPRQVSRSDVNIRGSQRSTQSQKTQSKSRTVGLKSYFMPRTSAGAQPTIKSALQTKEAKEKTDLAMSKWLIDACLPFNAVNSKFYQHAIDAIASMGAGYKGPSFHDMRGHLLTKNVAEVRNFVENFRAIWKETGCTIMADGWTDQCRRTLINFLVYCPKGTVFLKSIDATEASKTANVLYSLFREVVLFVGAENVVHMVTDNAANYVAAGRLLEQEFPTLYWSPCAAHCLNLMLQDNGKLGEVSECVFHAAKITKYVYNHTFVLHLMREHTGGREILRPAPTRFATNFIALESILSQKDALRQMVTCKEWMQSTYSRDSKGKKFTDLVLDSSFWKESATIVYITKPLVRVLRLVDSENRSAMGYMYAAIWKARGEILKRFERRKRRVAPYIRIIDSRWDSQLHTNLHAAGYWITNMM